MSRKVLITIKANNVAPRFDLSVEVLIVTLGKEGGVEKEKTVILPHSSPEDLCQMILSEEVETVICGGIEEEFYQYLTWKKVKVLDSVMGPWGQALDRFKTDDLVAGAVLFDRRE